MAERGWFSRGRALGAWIVVLLVACSATAAAGAAPSPRVVGGHEVDPPGAYPFVVALVRRGHSAAEGQYCGGALIAPDWVLTAAHCATLGYSGLDVMVGRHDLREQDGRRIRVVEIIVHPEYDYRTLANDVAVLRLARPAAEEPANLPDGALLEVPGAEVTVAGWGVTETRAGSNTLQEVQLALVSDPQCARAYDYFLPESMICAGDLENGGVDSCFGDSGGPLFARLGGRFTLVGVVSWGDDPCGQPGSPGVYARLSALQAWITAVSGVEPPSPTCGGVEATMVGTPGPDDLAGTRGEDVIAALGGDDVVAGSGGSDLICGSEGTDRLIGGGGADRLYGGAGADLLRGAGGADLLYGEGGDDLLYGGAGPDLLFGGPDDDALWGGAGSDEGYGGGGADRCLVETVGSCEA